MESVVCVIAQAISSRYLIVEVLVSTQISLCGILRQSGTGVGFSMSPSVFLLISFQICYIDK